MNQTSAFLGAWSAWNHARITLHDLHGLWGGRVIRVDGDGWALVRVAPIPQWERRFVLSLPPAEGQHLRALLIEHDFLTITFPQRHAFYPDETQTVITLMNAGGNIHRVTRWAADPPNARFEAIYAALRQLEQRAQNQKPTYEGSFDSDYMPRRGLRSHEFLQVFGARAFKRRYGWWPRATNAPPEPRELQGKQAQYAPDVLDGAR